MNFIKRAWLHLKAKKGKTGLLILINSAILVFVMSGLTIKSAADAAIQNAKNEAGASVTLQVNRESMMKKDQSSSSSNSNEPPKMEMTPISLSVAQKIAKMNGVKSYSFISTTTASAGSGIKAISSSESSSSSNSNDSKQFGGRGPEIQGDFTVAGVNTTSTYSEFTKGTNTITSGVGITSLTSDNEAVIEESLASANNLKVGSTFEITTTVNSETKTFKLKVVGIYKSSASIDSAQVRNTAMNPSNKIFVNLATANTMKGTSDTVDSAVFNISNPENLSNFASEAKGGIDTSKYQIVTSDEIYKQMLQPLNNVSTFAQNIVILVAIAGAVILTLIVILSIRERRYEIGVLMSLGESRLKIIGQFFIELLAVSGVSIFIASVAGNFVGNAIGSQLLAQQNSSSSSQMEQGGPGGAGGPGEMNSSDSNKSKSSDSENSNDSSSSTSKSGGNLKRHKPQGMGGPMGEMMGTMGGSAEIDKLDIKQSPADIAKLGGIAILITFISTILASISIVKLKPKEILTN